MLIIIAYFNKELKYFWNFGGSDGIDFSIVMYLGSDIILKKLIVICLSFCFAMPVFADSIDFNAKSVYLTEYSSGETLYENNADEKLPIASVTKIMTMLLIMEAVDSGKISLDDSVPVSERAMSMGGSTMFLETGEQLPVSEMLKGIAVASANDGAVAMAEFVAGSESAFVDMMNERAKELGMENTHFVNTNGLDDDNHYSTARDVAKMSRELLKHEKIFEYTTIWTDTMRDGKFELANTNKLIRFYSGANGLKTGSTSKALCCISASAKRDNMQLIAVVLGAPTSKDRFAAARGLLDYGFANYKVEKSISKGEEIARIPILKGKAEELPLIACDECDILLKKGNSGEIERKINIPENISAPVEKGESVGSVELYLDGELLASGELTAAESVEKKNYADFLLDAIRKLISC